MSLSGMLVCLFSEYSAAKMSGHLPATPDSILANNLVPCRPLAPQNKYIFPQLGLFCETMTDRPILLILMCATNSEENMIDELQTHSMSQETHKQCF